ncbi:Hypothetical protein A7982_03224 [Minicystis rosea]|nr:Hypothetical protein A7982_03224 [Minicystis rosea]
MFRSDRDALAGQVDDLRAENERLRSQNEAMRVDLLAHRAGAPPPTPTDVYNTDVARLSPGERAALAAHSLEAFPVWATVVLHVFTLGFASLVRFNLLHDRLPRAQHNDPTAAKGIGFNFIPYFNFYWVVFNTIRIADRINLQYRLRGRPNAVPRGFAVATGIFSAIPYVNLLAGSVMWLVMAIYLQRAVNQLAAEAKEPVEVARVAATGARIQTTNDAPETDEITALAEAEAEEAAATRRHL